MVAFVVATLSLGYALETTQPEWRDPEFGHRLPLLRTSKRPLVVFIGTSRTQNGIAPHAMNFTDDVGSPRVVNVGQSRATMLGELLTLHRVLDAGVRPTAVVVEIFPSSLVANQPAEVEFQGAVPKLSAADVRHLVPYCDNPSVLWQAWAKARVAPWHTQRQVLMSHWLPEWQPRSQRVDFQWTSLTADGFQPVPRVSAERRAKLTELALEQYAESFIGFAPGAASERALRDLVALCRQEEIPIAFLLPPLSPEFRAAFDSGVFAMSERYVMNLADELGVKVFPAPGHLIDDEFMDGHHLLEHGAERYSRWLADEHLKPLLANIPEL